VVRLAARGAFTGAVLDAGCGTGENALHVASLGLQVLGVDVAETAISTACETAAARGIDAEFILADARHLKGAFDTVLDCGLFHTFDADERSEYVVSLASVTRRGGNLYLLCFSDSEPDTGPHPVSESEIREAFSAGWSVTSVRPERLQSRLHPHGAPAWLATIGRG
jgi:cyclopropane fatty-acyl-phospholipid synthase-like methyltransferase